MVLTLRATSVHSLPLPGYLALHSTRAYQTCSGNSGIPGHLLKALRTLLFYQVSHFTDE